MSLVEQAWRHLARWQRDLGLVEAAAASELEADLRALWDTGMPVWMVEPSGWSVVAALAGEG